MPYSEVWNVNAPADGDLIKDGDDAIRQIKRAIQERWESFFEGMSVDPMRPRDEVIQNTAIIPKSLTDEQISDEAIITILLANGAVTFAKVAAALRTQMPKVLARGSFVLPASLAAGSEALVAMTAVTLLGGFNGVYNGSTDYLVVNGAAGLDALSADRFLRFIPFINSIPAPMLYVTNTSGALATLGQTWRGLVLRDQITA